MKNKILIFLVMVTITIGALFIRKYQSYNKLYDNYLVSISNNNAYLSELDTVKNLNKVFLFSTNQLNYLNDSIVNKLKLALNLIKIKDKNLLELYYISSKVTKTDTINLKGDTIFKDNTVKVDTILGDLWYNIRIKLLYPSTIITSPTFKSEKNVIVSYLKEFVNPPSKVWLFRLFQKKLKVVIVNVIENNPYITNIKNKFILIVK